MNNISTMTEKLAGIDCVAPGKTSYEDYLFNQLRQQMHGIDACYAIYRTQYYEKIAKLSAELAHLSNTRHYKSAVLYYEYLKWADHGHG